MNGDPYAAPDEHWRADGEHGRAADLVPAAIQILKRHKQSHTLRHRTRRLRIDRKEPLGRQRVLVVIKLPAHEPPLCSQNPLPTRISNLKFKLMPRHRGTCGTSKPSRVRFAGKLSTVLSVNKYSPASSQRLANFVIADNSIPRARIAPRFCRWRVMSAGVVDNVTFAIESSIWLQKKFPRTKSRSPNFCNPTPASPPVNLSAVNAAFAFVTTLPTRKFRYSSFNVGPRNAR